MKSDIGKFRLLSRVAFAVMVVVACSFICCVAFCFVGEMVAMAISLVVMVTFGIIAALLECAAYDNLICPKCGRRILNRCESHIQRRTGLVIARLPRVNLSSACIAGRKSLNPVNPVNPV